MHDLIASVLDKTFTKSKHIFYDYDSVVLPKVLPPQLLFKKQMDKQFLLVTGLDVKELLR